MSLLGLLRHLTSVENYWFQNVIAGRTGDRLYLDANGADLAFVVVPDDEMVSEAWSAWRSEVARSDQVLAEVSDLGQLGEGTAMPVREVIVHLIREYAQHLGHADLLRERIDGRVGQ